jgi:predicted dehydrogenase/acetyltransferase-like isoleucine patch superfamily enzyme
LKLICDNNEAALFQFKKQYPDIETCLTITDILHRDDIEGIVIATPAETHYTLAKESLLADKHVYVEKPLVLIEDEAKDLIALAHERNLRLMVGHLLQYHPSFVTLKEMVVKGDLGRINYIYSHRLNLGKIRREENILWSFAPHDISMILALAEEEPEIVLATGGNYLHKKIADVTTTHLEFPSGIRSHIFVSWLHPFKEQKLVVVGDKKMALFDDTQSWADKLLLYPHEIKWEHNIPVPTKAEPERAKIPEAEPLRQECTHFLHCIANGERPLTDGDEGLRVLKVLNACQNSLDHDGQTIYIRNTLISDKEAPSHIQPQSIIKDAPLKTAPSRQASDPFIHKTAIVDSNVSIGSGSKIWHFSHILSNSKIGNNCNVGQNVVIGPEVIIGNGCKIQNNVSIYKGVTLEDGVFCGPSMVFTNVYNPRAEIRKMEQLRHTHVGRGATIGANATIVCGNNLGCYSFIGAGAVVTKDVPAYALMVGNPARQKGWICECGEKLNSALTCSVCGKQYVSGKNGLTRKNEAS